jgi:hypothetical protein
LRSAPSDVLLSKPNTRRQVIMQKPEQKRTTNEKPIPHIPLPFKEVIADVLKVKPPERKPKKRITVRAPKNR